MLLCCKSACIEAELFMKPAVVFFPEFVQIR
jgi:hypothetical protein